MKRLLLILLGILLLLVSIIGPERFSSFTGDERKREHQTEFRSGLPIAHGSLAYAGNVENSVEKKDSKTPTMTDTMAKDLDRLPSPVIEGSGSGKRAASPIYFVRGKEIIGFGEADKGSIRVLQQAIVQVASGFESAVMILDLDGVVPYDSPFIVYANPKFDLTKPVESAYQNLKGKGAEEVAAEKTGEGF
jgi:hypothetical protein